MIDIPDSVFPQDPQGNLLCPRCFSQVNECRCPSIQAKKQKLPPPPSKIRIRLDKKHRSGKTVTIIEGLFPSESSLKPLCKKLKAKLGSGGSFYISNNVGVIELQGDHQKSLSLSDFS